MAVKHHTTYLALLSLLITALLLLALLFLSGILESKRQTVISDGSQQVSSGLLEMQTFLLMSELYGREMACLAFGEKLKELDTTIWILGQKIDQYKVASEEFRKNQYYVVQKRHFNENEVLYMILLQTLKRECGFHQAVIAFFYQNSRDCGKCDDQSFILSDINRDYDAEVAVFPFDTELNLSSVRLLSKYYNITQYPCVVIEDVPYCGIQDKEFILEKVCAAEPNLSFCSN